MSYKVFPAIIVVTLILFSCGSPKILVSNKTNAETAAASGDYASAVKSWELYFNQTPLAEVKGIEFATAAKAAFKSGNTVQAISWFDQARYKNYSDLEMYMILVEIYRKQKNISKELTALEYIKENYSEKSDQVNTRLFQIYNEIKLTDKALDIWVEMDSATKNELPNLTGYFEIQKQLKDSTVCDSIAPVILKKNPEQIEALDWMASRYYWMGEKRYQEAMETYNAKKTTRQYKILLNELDKSTADFKKSLTYLEKLWTLDQQKKYASYFANIYARFGDEKKSNYYQKFLN